MCGRSKDIKVVSQKLKEIEMIRLSCFWKDPIHKDESSNPKHSDDTSVNIITLAKCGPQ